MGIPTKLKKQHNRHQNTPYTKKAGRKHKTLSKQCRDGRIGYKHTSPTQQKKMKTSKLNTLQKQHRAESSKTFKTAHKQEPQTKNY